MRNPVDLSISIVSWNTRELLDKCLKSVYDSAAGLETEVIVVDNASSDGSAAMIRTKYPDCRLIQNDSNMGFATANNQAYRASVGRHFLLLNSDTLCLRNALESLVSFLDTRESVGAVGPLVLNEDRTLQFSWARFPTFMNECFGRLDRRLPCASAVPLSADEVRRLGPFETDWVGGCCLMIRREAADQIGPMDESLFMYCEETDWCLRLHTAGWSVMVNPGAEIVHLGGQSSVQVSAKASRYLRASKSRYFAKHHGRLAGSALDVILAAKACASSLRGRTSD